MKNLHDTFAYKKVGVDKKFSAGFSRFQLVDANRRELFDTKRNRQFEVLVWYPGEVVTPQTAKKKLPEYRNKLSITRDKNITKPLVNHSIKSFEGISLSEAKATYPVLLFSHDIGAMPEYYTELMEVLAEEGYFIFSINHTYLSKQTTLTELNQCRTVTLKKRAMFIQWMLQKEIKSTMSVDSYESKWELGKKRSFAKRWASEYIAEWCWDKKFLLNYLQELTRPKFSDHMSVHNFFAERLNFSQVAVLGHGWGGSSGVHSLLTDKRIKAAINMNGFQFSEGMENRITKPLLMIYSEEFSGLNDGIYFSPLDYKKITIPDSSDAYFFDRGHHEITNKFPEYSTEIVNQKVSIILSFLDEHMHIPYQINLKTRQIL